MDNPIEFAHNASIKELTDFLKKANTLRDMGNQ